MSDVLVQTRVPDRTAAWVSQRAEADGDSVAGWLRRLLVREAGMAAVAAWLVSERQSDPRVFFNDPPKPHVVLELVTRLSGDEGVYTPVDPRTGSPKPERWFRETDFFREPEKMRFLMAGSPYPLKLAASQWNTRARRLEWTLRVERNGR